MTRVEVCCGLGGVGKTTAAAALALSHARAGARVVVMTIDPARRLADALGLEYLGNDPHPVPLDGIATAGTLDALMLDRKKTFDNVIRRFAPNPETATRLVQNRYYRAVSERLGGSHEYMAMEKLYDLVEDERWDVVVVDTPPTQHALDFFRAPERVGRLFDRTTMKLLMRPSRGLFSVTSRAAASVVQRLVGEGVLDDIGEFFSLLGGMSTGFRERGHAVHRLLASRRTRYFLVTSAAAPARSDALAFLDALRERDMQFGGFLVNRVAADPDVATPLDPEAISRPDGVDAEVWAAYLGALDEVVAYARATVRRQRDAIDELRIHRPDAPLWTVPDRPGGVRTLRELAELADHLPPADPTPS